MNQIKYVSAAVGPLREHEVRFALPASWDVCTEPCKSQDSEALLSPIIALRCMPTNMFIQISAATVNNEIGSADWGEAEFARRGHIIGDRSYTYPSRGNEGVVSATDGAANAEVVASCIRNGNCVASISIACKTTQPEREYVQEICESFSFEELLENQRIESVTKHTLEDESIVCFEIPSSWKSDPTHQSNDFRFLCDREEEGTKRGAIYVRTSFGTNAGDLEGFVRQLRYSDDFKLLKFQGAPILPVDPDIGFDSAVFFHAKFTESGSSGDLIATAMASGDTMV